MIDHQEVEKIFQDQGYADFKWITGKDIVVSQWVRMKCTFGCASFGKNGSCPPNTPSLAECREFFSEYSNVALLHFGKSLIHPDDRKVWSRDLNMQLLELERAVFLAGYRKAFLLFMDECRLCAECTGSRQGCKIKGKSRPSPESMGVDVFATVKKIGYPIEVLKSYDQEMNRYAFLLVD